MNPINYARGLADEFDGCLRSGDKEREAAVRESLAWVAGELGKIAPESLSGEIRELYDAAKSAVVDALATKPKRASAAKS
jgi:hypothetical protein